MRRSLVVGNWKLNGSLAQLNELIGQLLNAKLNQDVDVAVCPSYVYLSDAKKLLIDSSIGLGAQNVASEVSGAYTGEVSAAMLTDVGCDYVIVGHSERRELFGETDELVANKTLRCINNSLKPILCVGETLVERENEQTLDVVSRQLLAVLNVLDEEQLTDLVIAYEPVWAIGTGLTATPEQAQGVHAHIRDIVKSKSASAAETMQLLYGGSVKEDNAALLFEQADIDGGLVGGASLKADTFVGIINSIGK